MKKGSGKEIAGFTAVCFEGLECRVSRLSVRGSREIKSAPSLHRTSTDALMKALCKLLQPMCYFCSDIMSVNLAWITVILMPHALADVDGGFERFCNIGFEGDGTTCISECGLTSVLCFHFK